MSTRRPSDSGRPDKNKVKKSAYPVARPVNPPAAKHRPAPVACPAAARPDPNLAFSLDDPPVPGLTRPRRPGLFRRMRPVLLVFVVILLGVGTVAFAFTYRKGGKHKIDPNAVAKVDHESDKKAEKKPEATEKKPEEKKPEEKKPEKVEEKKPAEKKPEEKKPAEKKPEEKKPEEKKPTEKKPEEKKPEEKKPAEKKPEEKKPEEKKPAEKPEEKKPAVDPKLAAILFEKDILPIFNAKCIFCHGDKKKKGGLDMRTVELMMKGGDSGTSLVRGQPDKSNLWIQIEGDLMPKNEPLSKEDKEKIRKWILGGARDAAMAAK